MVKMPPTRGIARGRQRIWTNAHQHINTHRQVPGCTPATRAISGAIPCCAALGPSVAHWKWRGGAPVLLWRWPHGGAPVVVVVGLDHSRLAGLLRRNVGDSGARPVAANGAGLADRFRSHVWPAAPIPGPVFCQRLLPRAAEGSPAFGGPRSGRTGEDYVARRPNPPEAPINRWRGKTQVLAIRAVNFLHCCSWTHLTNLPA